MKILSIETDNGEIFSVGDKIKHLVYGYNNKTIIELTPHAAIIEGGHLVSFNNISLHIEPEFVLPENWHVVTTPETKEILCNWKGFTNGFRPEGQIIIGIVERNEGFYKSWNRLGCISSDTFDFGEEITFEQFKNHVLKED